MNVAPASSTGFRYLPARVKTEHASLFNKLALPCIDHIFSFLSSQDQLAATSTCYTLASMRSNKCDWNRKLYAVITPSTFQKLKTKMQELCIEKPLSLKPYVQVALNLHKLSRIYGVLSPRAQALYPYLKANENTFDVIEPTDEELQGAFSQNLQAASRIKSFHCESIQWSETGISELQNLTSLETLDVKKPNLKMIRYFSESENSRSLLRITFDWIPREFAKEAVILLAKSQSLRFLKSITICYSTLDDEAASVLAESDILATVKRLILFRTHMGPEGARLLAESKKLRSLETLNMEGTNTLPRGVRAIAQSPNFSPLRFLLLASLDMKAEDARFIAESKNSSSLISLKIDDNSIGDRGVEHLVNSSNLSSLQRFNISANHISPRGVALLANSINMRALKILDLNKNRIQSEGVKLLAKSEYIHSLESLGLQDCGICAEGVASLTASKNFLNLTSLDLSHNPLRDRGAFYLSEAKNFPSLKRICLVWSSISHNAAIALKKSEPMQNLELTIVYDFLRN